MSKPFAFILPDSEPFGVKGKTLGESVWEELDLYTQRFDKVVATPNIWKDGCFKFRIEESIRGRPVYIFAAPYLSPPSQQSFANAQIIDACCRSSADKIILVETYNPWYAQDKRDVGFREPGSGQLVADFYKCAGLTHMFYFEPHSLPAMEGWYKPLDTIYMAAFHAAHLRKEFELDNSVVGVPDDGSTSRSKRLAEALHIPIVKIGKTRDLEKQDEESAAMSVMHNLKGKTVFMYDDMIRTGGTAIKTSKPAKEAGARRVVYLATHLEITKPDELFNSGYIDAIRGTDTNPVHPSHSKLGIYDVAPYIAHIMYRRSTNRDISGFAGNPDQITKVLKL